MPEIGEKSRCSRSPCVSIRL